VIIHNLLHYLIYISNINHLINMYIIYLSIKSYIYLIKYIPYNHYLISYSYFIPLIFYYMIIFIIISYPLYIIIQHNQSIKLIPLILLISINNHIPYYYLYSHPSLITNHYKVSSLNNIKSKKYSYYISLIKHKSPSIKSVSTLAL